MKRCCAPRYVFDLLGRKWTFKLLRHLREEKTFSDLQELLPGITNHILAEETKMLVDEGLVIHKDRSYVLSEAGVSLLEATKMLLAWGERYQQLAHCPEEQACNKCARYEE